MTTTALERNYKKLEGRLQCLEQAMIDFLSEELKEDKSKKLEAISQKIDSGHGKRFISYDKFKSYLKSL